LKIRKRLAEHLSRRHAHQRLVERAAREPERSGSHAGAKDVERAHGDLETFAGHSDEMRDRNSAGLKSQPRQRMWCGNI
jgi:hypothetical protein